MRTILSGFLSQQQILLAAKKAEIMGSWWRKLPAVSYFVVSA